MKRKESTKYTGLAAIGMIIVILLIVGNKVLDNQGWIAYFIAGGLAVAIGYRIIKGDFTASITSKYSEED